VFSGLWSEINVNDDDDDDDDDFILLMYPFTLSRCGLSACIKVLID